MPPADSGCQEEIRYKSEPRKKQRRKRLKASHSKGYRGVGYFLICLTLGETYMSHPRALHKAVTVNQKMVKSDLEMIVELTQYD